MATVEVKFKAGQYVWLMYGNKPTEAPVSEIHLHQSGKIKYYFWHQDFPFKDTNVFYDNLVPISESQLFETKEELLNSL